MTAPSSGAYQRAATVRAIIGREPGPADGPGAFLRRVCRAASRELAASGVGVTVMAGQTVSGVSTASDPASEQIEELQFVLGEGPCIDAFTERRPVLTADLAAAAMTKWPVYGPAAYRAGVRSIFAFPLQVGAVGLGVMDVIRHRVGPLTGVEITTAMVFADVTVEALLDRHQAAGAHPGEGDDPGTDVTYRAQLFQAQGMVMVQLGVSIGEALVRIRAFAYAENRRIEDVAHDLVNRTLQFDRDADEGQARS